MYEVPIFVAIPIQQFLAGRGGSSRNTQIKIWQKLDNLSLNIYHEQTKYDPDTIHSKNRQLDWEDQPVPFKDYKFGTAIDLKPYLKEKINQQQDSPEAENLSNLFICSYGLTGKILTITGNYYLRASPSAGGLYPAEIYLISRGTPLLPTGLYLSLIHI